MAVRMDFVVRLVNAVIVPKAVTLVVISVVPVLAIAVVIEVPTAADPKLVAIL